MKFEIEEWKLEELYKRRNQINFPVFQRGVVWSEGKNKLLVDSIMRGIDIPKLYLQKTDDGWDCIDGQQRIRAIIGFFDEEFEYNGDIFPRLSDSDKEKFENYKLTVAIVHEISEEEIRMLFKRLQLGVPLNAGEKLNAIKSNLGDFVKKMAQSNFIKNLSIPSRRFAKEQVCAQICNNSIYINKTGDFRNSKYEDLENLYTWNKDFDLDSDGAKSILQVLEKLDDIFSTEAAEIRNRASAVSIYLMVERLMYEDRLKGKEGIIREFYLAFLRKLKDEVRKGIDATNHFLINYQGKIIQAADSKSAIKSRHEMLMEAFDYYVSHREIIGF